jgi:hypothetical protein
LFIFAFSAKITIIITNIHTKVQSTINKIFKPDLLPVSVFTHVSFVGFVSSDTHFSLGIL